jgi:hypothetical protein
MDILKMHRFADHDHAFIGKDAGIAHGNFPLVVPVNTADKYFPVKSGSILESGIRVMGEFGAARSPPLRRQNREDGPPTAIPPVV